VLLRAILIAAAIATAAVAMAGLGPGRAHAEPGTLTPQQVRYLAQLNAAGVPFTDPYAAVMVGLDACEDLHGGRSDEDRYAEDLGNAGGGSWTHAQDQSMIFAAGSFLCP
jgi:Protein of unknown function (DUF732)